MYMIQIQCLPPNCYKKLKKKRKGIFSGLVLFLVVFFRKFSEMSFCRESFEILIHNIKFDYKFNFVSKTENLVKIETLVKHRNITEYVTYLYLVLYLVQTAFFTMVQNVFFKP